jgi:hypothetical protein
MQDQATHASGHVFCVERKRGPQWYCKYRVGGKQVQKRLGPAWILGGLPPDGYFTKRAAQAALEAILTDARRGALPGVAVTGSTVADAAEEWLRHGECERGIKASTLSEYATSSTHTSSLASATGRSAPSCGATLRPGRRSCSWAGDCLGVPSTRSSP